MLSMKNQTALITGASSGLGAEFARQLASAGCHLILVARRKDAMHSLANRLKEHDVTITIIGMDLSSPDAADDLFLEVREKGLSVDLLINNAGYGLHGEFITHEPEQIRRMLQLNMVTLTLLTRLFLDDMKARGSGRILQVGSVASFQPGPLYGAYSASKAYVLSLGESLNYELRGSGVTCTVVCPGVTETGFLDNAGQKSKRSFYQRMVMMQAEDVVRIGLKATLKGQSAVVTGWINKIQIFLLRLTPRRLMAAAGYWGLKLD